ncbi:MAG: agmatine deiminase family protein [Bacteroidales bacterium]|nr:agmatine deiminase family protein [Bacteroidales bacterium]
MKLPAEWEKQSFVQLTWPHPDTAWYDLPSVLDCYVNIARTLVKYEPLLIVCRDRQECLKDFADRGVSVEGWPLSLAECPLNDTWARDHGGITVLDEEGKPVVLDVVFNGWGLKFGADLDNQITRRLFSAGIFAPGVGYRDMRPFVLEGGSIDTDGEGTLLTTSECLCSLNRNEYLSEEEIGSRLADAFGLKRILWLDHGTIAGDDTDSHVDILARFCSPDTIAYTSCDNPADENYAPLKAMEEQLRTFTTADGKPYRLLPLPLPDPLYLDDYRLPASYANFLIVNGAVLMPGAGSPKDEQAAAVLASAFPGRKIEVIDCRALLSGHGGLHCITMQYPQACRLSARV